MLTCIWVNKRSLLLGGYEEMWQGFFLVSKSIGPELPHRSMEFGWLSVTLCRQTKSSLLTTKTRRFPYWHRSVGYVRFTNPYLKSYLPTFSRIHHKQVFCYKPSNVHILQTCQKIQFSQERHTKGAHYETRY